MSIRTLRRISQATTQALGISGDPKPPCFDASGEVPAGTLEASLKAELNHDDLTVEIPLSTEKNLWSMVQTSGPNEYTQDRILDGQTITVPKDRVALVWFEIETAFEPTRIRFSATLDDGVWLPVAPTLRVKRNGNVLMFWDDNRDNPEDHVWSFGVLIDGKWYDPQLRNQGTEPPPP